jgi:hypothetical protein
MSKVRADNYTDRTGASNPTLPYGVVVTGVCSATDFSGTGLGAADFPNGITGVAATFTGNVTVGGTLISEDTTNIDSVGWVTARNGLNVGPPATGIGATVQSNGDAVFAGIVTSAGAFTASSTATVSDTLTINGLNSNKALIEKVNVTAGKLSDNLTINIDNGMVHLFTTTETTTAVPNIISTAGINTDLAVGDAISVSVICTAAAAGYAAEWQIDGIAVTETWVGGSAPSAGGASGTDTYSMNIIKTASATYTVIGNLTNAA